MSDPTPTPTPQPAPRAAPSFSARRVRLFGLDSDQIIKAFFGLNALAALVVLALITIFLFKEGLGFIGKYQTSLKVYRLSGLEYVDILKQERDAYTELSRYQNSIRTEWMKLMRAEGKTQGELVAAINAPEVKAFFREYRNAGRALRDYSSERMEAAIELRDQYITNENFRSTIEYFDEKIQDMRKRGYSPSHDERQEFSMRVQEAVSGRGADSQMRQTYLALAESIKDRKHKLSEAERLIVVDVLESEKDKIRITPINFEESIKPVIGDRDEIIRINDEMEEKIQGVLELPLSFEDKALQERLDTFKRLSMQFIQELPKYESKLMAWSPTADVSYWDALGAFLTGDDWVTASDQQDWYGLLPLLSGSLLISFVALTIAVPFGVGAAIYVNQIAGARERNFIKPYIEFIDAIPSVVIGFFGVMVLGQAIRELSQMEFMAWVPFFPLQERLNAFTAGCLLALMAIPTIFTLSEDAINNVPRHMREASMAMGSTRLQTTMRIIVPTALSGIISAVMLGFGRVVGETMVVLLCAGNRIKIPDFSSGVGVFFEPVHTMTGIIAQEMGEVVHGSLHYRALFMVGIVLFFISLIINYSAQWVVKKFRRIGD